MRMDPSKKISMLEETYEMLKDDYSGRGNSTALKDIIGKISAIDIDRALEMWKELIEKYPNVLHNDNDFTFSIFYAIEQSIGDEEAQDAVFEDDELVRLIYSEGGDLGCCPMFACRRLVELSDYDKLDTVLSYVENNRYASQTLYDFLDDILDVDPDEVDEDFVDYISEWMEKITKKEDKAKLNVKLLGFFD